MSIKLWSLKGGSILFFLIFSACVQQPNHRDTDDAQNDVSEKVSQFEENVDSISFDTAQHTLETTEDRIPKNIEETPLEPVNLTQKNDVEEDAPNQQSLDSVKKHFDQIEVVSKVEKYPELQVDTLESMELDKKQVSQQIDPVAIDVPSYPNHRQFGQLLESFVSTDGKVNYAGFLLESASLELYLTQLKNNPPDEKWPRNEQLAFWINAYNAFTIRLILDNHPVESILDIEKGNPWDKKWIQIGERSYSLNQIENEVIRPQFMEPRIHFAINCAAVSCPPLGNRAFTSKNLNQLLEKQTHAFVNHSAFNQISKDSLVLSKIFEWYNSDFPDLISFLNQYVKDKIGPDADIRFLDYNWALNQ